MRSTQIPIQFDHRNAKGWPFRKKMGMASLNAAQGQIKGYPANWRNYYVNASSVRLDEIVLAASPYPVPASSSYPHPAHPGRAPCQTTKRHVKKATARSGGALAGLGVYIAIRPQVSPGALVLLD